MATPRPQEFHLLCSLFRTIIFAKMAKIKGRGVDVVKICLYGKRDTQGTDRETSPVYRISERYGLTLAELAERLDISIPYLWRIEAGERPITPWIAMAAQQRLGIRRNLLRPDLWK